jgi:hypothetical protein
MTARPLNRSASRIAITSRPAPPSMAMVAADRLPWTVMVSPSAPPRRERVPDALTVPSIRMSLP